jgi:hypothetical protein
MALRDRAELAAGAAVLLVCAAFVVSFGVGLRRGGEPAVEDAAVPAFVVRDRAAGRLEVLNASGRAGLARAATAELREGGFDVVYYGNAPGSDGDSSVVLARVGSDGVARAAATKLGIARVQAAPDSALFVDATVILGRDWVVAEPAAAPRPEDWRSRIGRWLRPGA